ncbi:MAG: hypothetical protein JSR67_00935 [Proteobacteria bacterium]|nr:hypothetical protein [Pseudomonadota bacterium]
MAERGDSLTLGLDLGTSALKAVVADADGRVLATASAPFDTLSDVPGQAEQNPADWLRAARVALAELDALLDGKEPRWRRRVAAIGLAGQLPTLVVLGKSGALGNAFTWKDTRADALAAQVLGDNRRTLYRRTGMPIDGRYLGPMFRQHWGARSGEARWVLGAKDYLCHALTGEHVTDPSTAAGYGVFDLAQGAFDERLCEPWGLRPDMLPQIRPAHSHAGTLSRAGAALLGLRPGLPVTVGAADSVAGAYAMAQLREGTACVAMGSSTIILDAVHELRLDPAQRYLLTPHVEPGWYGREMDLLATGTGYDWLSSLFRWTAPGELDSHAAQSVPGAQGLTFTPYLAGGEQGALWDPTLRGTLSGLTLRHGREDIARAFLEGVGFEMRRCLEVLAEATPVHEVVLAGHLTEIPSSLQLLADILDRPIRPYPPLSAAALGAAMGAFASLTPAATVRPHIDATWPQPVRPGEQSGVYRGLYREYLAASAG